MSEQETSAKVVKEQIIGREFRFAIHLPETEDRPDTHLVKEQVHFKIGDRIEIRPMLRKIVNFKRPVYFTRPNLRTYREKRETEPLENVYRVDTTQSNIRNVVWRNVQDDLYRRAKEEGRKINPAYMGLREMCGSPYVYAADIPSTLFIRQSLYAAKYDVSSPNTVAMFDTETDMVDGIGDIIMASAIFDSKVCVAVQERKLKGYSHVQELFNRTCSKHLQKFIDEHNLEIEFFVCPTEIDVVKTCFKFIHECQPDFLAIWNMNFDIPKVLEACERAGVDPKLIFCDPRIPPELQHCEYIQGPTSQKTASGKHKPIRAANQWHTLKCTASYYVIDAMCAYRRIRGGAELVSYSLDDILQRELKLTKLRIPEAEKFRRGRWHKFMQERMIFDYIAYNIFDSFSMLLLDKKTQDLTSTLPFLADLTNYEDYSAQTKRLRDNFFAFAHDNLGQVLGSVGPKPKDKPHSFGDFDEDGNPIEADMEEEEDDEDDGPKEYKTLDRRDWVITLRSYLSKPGLKLIKGEKYISTLFRAFVYDNDVVSSYPRCILVANVSRMTTRKELSRIVGIPEAVFRMQNLNLVFGATNHLEYAQNMLNFPKFREADRLFKEHLRGQGRPVVTPQQLLEEFA